MFSSRPDVLRWMNATYTVVFKYPVTGTVWANIINALAATGVTTAVKMPVATAVWTGVQAGRRMCGEMQNAVFRFC